MICDGQIGASEVAQALSRRFLTAIADSEFFGRLTSEDLVKIYGSPEAATASLEQAQKEVTAYIDGTDREFAESLFERVQPAQKPDLPRQSTTEQMDNDLDVNVGLLDEDIA